MNFPKRIKQHKAQSDSFAILLYHLRNVGIFRSATENDYGIDFEIEMIENERVIGKYLKVQVKSSEDVYIREDKVPTVGGIKQSTLLYWTELSYSTHVLVFAVDIKTEKIFFTRSVFWQATALLDKGESTKTIEFLKELDFDNEKVERSNKERQEIMLGITEMFIKVTAYGPSISEIINAHKSILRNLVDIFELYTDTWHLDAHTEVQEVSAFKLLLDCAAILVPLTAETPTLNKKERNNLYKFEYWESQTNWFDDQVQNYIAQKPLKVIIPLLLDRLEDYNKRIMDARYYWKHKDWPYLKLVQSIKLPSARDHEALVRLDYDRYNFYANRDPNFFYTID